MSSIAATQHGLEPALLDICDKVASLSNLTNAARSAAAAIGLRRTCLEYMAARIARFLEARDFQGATFAFDVLSAQCGDALPDPDFMRSRSGEIVMTLGGTSHRKLEYHEQVTLAADLLGSLDALDRSLDAALATMRAACAGTGQDYATMHSALRMLYATQP
jgi:translation initiation factor IF-2